MKAITRLNSKLRCLLVVLLPIAFAGHADAQDAPIRILVSGEHVGTNIVYRYTVVNNSQALLNNFTIGNVFDAERRDEKPQLGKLPVGWKYGERGEIGVEIILDPASTTQPSGWVPWVYGQQDAGFYYLEWRIPSENKKTTPFLKPGQSLSGFSVTVPKGADPQMVYSPKESWEMYSKGDFKVGFWLNSQHQEFRGSIQKFDTTPPFVSVSVAPSNLWPPNGKLSPVSVTISVKDDHDPAPQIKLESITANESLEADDVSDAVLGTDDRSFKLAAKRQGGNKSGRIYTITYSAIDATGNKVTASTTVTVPHDKGK